jgi:hypothetical protein
MEQIPMVQACGCDKPRRVDIHCRTADGQTKSAYWVRCGGCSKTGPEAKTERGAVMGWNALSAAGPAR